MAKIKETPPLADRGSDRILQILTVAAELFAQKGYDGTSMRDVAETCDISKSLLYHHFKSKDDIYNQITLGTTHQLYLYVAKNIPEDGTSAEKIKAFMVATAEFFQRYRWAWIASTYSFWGNSDRAGQQERMVWRDRYEGLLRELINRGIASGELRDVDAPLTGRLILSSLNWMPRWYNPQRVLSATQIAEEYFQLIFKGIENDRAS